MVQYIGARACTPFFTARCCTAALLASAMLAAKRIPGPTAKSRYYEQYKTTKTEKNEGTTTKMPGSTFSHASSLATFPTYTFLLPYSTPASCTHFTIATARPDLLHHHFTPHMAERPALFDDPSVLLVSSAATTSSPNATLPQKNALITPEIPPSADGTNALSLLLDLAIANAAKEATPELENRTSTSARSSPANPIHGDSGSEATSVLAPGVLYSADYKSNTPLSYSLNELLALRAVPEVKAMQKLLGLPDKSFWGGPRKAAPAKEKSFGRKKAADGLRWEKKPAGFARAAELDTLGSDKISQLLGENPNEDEPDWGAADGSLAAPIDMGDTVEDFERWKAAMRKRAESEFSSEAAPAAAAEAAPSNAVDNFFSFVKPKEKPAQDTGANSSKSSRFSSFFNGPSESARSPQTPNAQQSPQKPTPSDQILNLSMGPHLPPSLGQDESSRFFGGKIQPGADFGRMNVAARGSPGSPGTPGTPGSQGPARNQTSMLGQNQPPPSHGPPAPSGPRPNGPSGPGATGPAGQNPQPAHNANSPHGPPGLPPMFPGPYGAPPPGFGGANDSFFSTLLNKGGPPQQSGNPQHPSGPQRPPPPGFGFPPNMNGGQLPPWMSAPPGNNPNPNQASSSHPGTQGSQGYQLPPQNMGQQSPQAYRNMPPGLMPHGSAGMGQGPYGYPPGIPPGFVYQQGLGSPGQMSPGMHMYGNPMQRPPMGQKPPGGPGADAKLQ